MKIGCVRLILNHIFLRFDWIQPRDLWDIANSHWSYEK